MIFLEYFVFSILLFSLYLKVSHDTQQPMRVSQRCSRDCSGVLAVASLEETQGLLSRLVCVYLGYITQKGALVGSALSGCYEPTAQVLLYRCTLQHAPMFKSMKCSHPSQRRKTLMGGLIWPGALKGSTSVSNKIKNCLEVQGLGH